MCGYISIYVRICATGGSHEVKDCGYEKVPRFPSLIQCPCSSRGWKGGNTKMSNPDHFERKLLSIIPRTKTYITFLFLIGNNNDRGKVPLSLVTTWLFSRFKMETTTTTKNIGHEDNPYHDGKEAFLDIDFFLEKWF